jgi:membrane protein YqaA with SNARE-associated domain
MDSVYLDIIKDSFLSFFPLTVSEEFAYAATISFGKHDVFISTLSAIAGSSFGLIVTYLAFYGLALLLKKLLDSNSGYPAAQHYTNKLSPVFAIVMAFPQIAVIPAFFFGITKLKFTKLLALVIFFRSCYYMFFLFNAGVIKI